MRQAVKLGYRLAHPKQICQDIEILKQFTEFDYDLTNLAYVDYFENRTGVKISWCACGWDHIRGRKHDWATWDEFVDCQWANKIAIYSRPDPNDETWRRILRAQMQDCWELYCEQPGLAELRAWPVHEEPDDEHEPEPQPLRDLIAVPGPQEVVCASAQLELF